MSKRGSLLVVASSLVCAGVASAAPASPVTVYLERHGRTVDHDGAEVDIPAFGGGDRAWSAVSACVKQQFSPFQIEVVDSEPRGEHITAVIGGKASLLDLDDRSTNGVGPYIPGQVQRNATVHIFSQVGTGERDTQNLCAVTVHEVSHALGLDHTFKCGDIMSYFLDRCGARRLMDVDAPCGETSARTCGTGEKTQNSYRMLAALVGLKGQPTPKPPPPDDEGNDNDDPWADDSNDGQGSTNGTVNGAGRGNNGSAERGPNNGSGYRGNDDSTADDGDDGTADDGRDDSADDGSDDDGATATQYYRDRQGNLYTMERVQGRDGHTYLVLRRVTARQPAPTQYAPAKQPATRNAPAKHPASAHAPAKQPHAAKHARHAKRARWMR